jgi:hypothetical protein
MGTIFAQAGPVESTQLIVLGILIVLALLPTVFWILQLVDCIENERPGSSEKIRSTVLIAALGLFGAFAYNVGRRKKRIQDLGR